MKYYIDCKSPRQYVADCRWNSAKQEWHWWWSCDRDHKTMFQDKQTAFDAWQFISDYVTDKMPGCVVRLMEDKEATSKPVNTESSNCNDDWDRAMRGL